jgi:hypothetical protein
LTNLSLRAKSNKIDAKLRAKGQLISECLFGVFNFPKKTLQKFDEFLP